MIERICINCNCQFEHEDGDDSELCFNCILEFKKETKEEQFLRKSVEVDEEI